MSPDGLFDALGRGHVPLAHLVGVPVGPGEDQTGCLLALHDEDRGAADQRLPGLRAAELQQRPHPRLLRAAARGDRQDQLVAVVGEPAHSAAEAKMVQPAAPAGHLLPRVIPEQVRVRYSIGW
jgi:hypothetical protein